MTVEQHGAASVLLGAGLLVATGSLPQAVVAALASVLIDFDHVIDFILEQRKVKRLGVMMDYYHNMQFERVFFIFHSIELVIIAGTLAFILHMTLVLSLAIGAGFHVLCDFCYWVILKKKTRTATYFFVFRAWNGFHKSRILLDDV